MRSYAAPVATLTAALLIVAAPLHGLAVTRPALTVHIVDYANVGRDEIARASAEATRIWSGINVALTWRDGEEKTASREPALDVVVIVLNREMAQRMIVSEHRGDGVLGRAVPEALRAYIFYDRVKNASAQFSAPRGVVLGDVFAHELGHLLTGHNHSSSGLMRAEPELGSTRLAFALEDGRRIRAGILQKIGGDAR